MSAKHMDKSSHRRKYINRGNSFFHNPFSYIPWCSLSQAALLPRKTSAMGLLIFTKSSWEHFFHTLPCVERKEKQDCVSHQGVAWTCYTLISHRLRRSFWGCFSQDPYSSLEFFLLRSPHLPLTVECTHYGQRLTRQRNPKLWLP